MDISNLNSQQKEAVKTTEGPLLVLAGAGSGKTKVLTTRIAYLIEEKNIKPNNILAITFTNKAAKEMKERVINLIGPIAYQIQISTFHSLGVLLMKENAKLLGYKDNFTILDSDDSLSVIKKIMKDLGYDTKDYNPKLIRNLISSAKNALLNPNEYEKYANDDITRITHEVYIRYQTKLFTNNSFDFDDLLIKPIELFRKHPDVLKTYQEKYQYLLIDEYQDTNEPQYILSKMLSSKYKNICVVGDNDQSIYSFRGSNYKNILNFEKDYQNVKTIMLEENYRSTKNILGASNCVIKNNIERKDKNLWTSNSTGDLITRYEAVDEKDEAYYVTTTIKDLIEKGTKKENIAILYRTNAQSRSMEDAIRRENIPYKVVGSFYFYNRKEIKDLISYLKIIYNPDDDVSLLRVINVPKRGIGEKTIDNLVTKANDSNQSINDAITSGKELEFKKILDKLRIEKDTLTITELVDAVLDKTGIRKELTDDKSIESEIRLENLEEFKSVTKNFEDSYGSASLEDFLTEISLVADIEEHKNNPDVVTLMTIHSAKGLEFDNVFIIGVEEGIFPHNNSLIENNLEEERRLCYVAMTRAKQKLWMINARRRLLYGTTNENMPSRFLKEIDNKYFEQQEVEIKPKTFNKEDEYDDTVTYNIGDHIKHTTYGEGIIVSIKGNLINVAFGYKTGIKTLIKGHKSIRKV